MKSSHTGFKRIISATRYSWLGYRSAFKHEAAFRQECFLLAVAVPLAFWWGKGLGEWALLIGSLLLLLLVELLNSAIEAVVDRVGDDYHPLSGRAKDMASAAVFTAILLVALVWGVVGYQKFF